MKKLIAILFAVAVAGIGLLAAHAANPATTYYIDSDNGNDSFSGTSEDEAWQTVENLKGLALQPGDRVLFRKGMAFVGGLELNGISGTKDAPIVISSYGSGERPILTVYEKKDVLDLIDCSYITVSGIEFCSNEGGGMWIDTRRTASEGITVEDCSFHGFQNHKMTSRDDLSGNAAAARACIIVKSLPARSRFPVNNLTIRDCDMYDCGNGISLWGSWNDAQDPWCDTEEEIDPVFNKGVLVKNIFFHNLDAEAIVVGMCDGALVTDCRMIDCCLGEGTDENGKVLYYNAAAWFWGSVNSTIQRCEIAGQRNVGDGMTVDFDSYSHNCTYQYIYSHDNTRFMCNCPNYSGHHGNTVRYCLSVNDNRGRSRAAGDAGEHGFKFYNNTIINCGDFWFLDITDAYVANNIIIPADDANVSYDLDAGKRGNTFTNNCYYNCMIPLVERNSVSVEPGFVGGEGADAYRLMPDSPLIGAGAETDSGLDTDLFGEKITGNNIGCYGGNGVGAGTYQKECFFRRVFRMILMVFKMIKNEILAIFE